MNQLLTILASVVAALMALGISACGSLAPAPPVPGLSDVYFSNVQALPGRTLRPVNSTPLSDRVSHSVRCWKAD